MRIRSSVTLIAALLCAVLSATSSMAQTEDKSPWRPDEAWEGVIGGGLASIERLTALLALSPEQQSRLKTIQQEEAKKSRPLVKRADDALAHFDRLIDAPQRDAEAMEKALSDVRQTAAALAAAESTAFERVKAVLTPAQLDKIESEAKSWTTPTATVERGGKARHVAPAPTRPAEKKAVRRRR